LSFEVGLFPTVTQLIPFLLVDVLHYYLFVWNCIDIL
jgi:hypothetical protein